MIKHDDSPTIMNKLGEFGVVRNSVYDITVNKINNPGYPIIPDPDPSAPDEEEDRYLSINGLGTVKLNHYNLKFIVLI